MRNGTLLESKRVANLREVLARIWMLDARVREVLKAQAKLMFALCAEVAAQRDVTPKLKLVENRFRSV